MKYVVMTSNKEYENTVLVVAKMLEKQGFSSQIFFEKPDDYEKYILENSKKLNLLALDLVTADLVFTKNENRLTSAAISGIPQIISVLGLESQYVDGEKVATKPELLDVLGKTIVERASASQGPTLIVLPSLSTSNQKTEALHQSIRNWVYPPELLVETEFSACDQNFANLVVSKLASLKKL